MNLCSTEAAQTEISFKSSFCQNSYLLMLMVSALKYKSHGRSPDLKYSYVTIALGRYGMEMTEQFIAMCSLLYTVLNNKK